jgi:hypothetical protein
MNRNKHIKNIAHNALHTFTIQHFLACYLFPQVFLKNYAIIHLHNLQKQVFTKKKVEIFL